MKIAQIKQKEEPVSRLISRAGILSGKRDIVVVWVDNLPKVRESSCIEVFFWSTVIADCEIGSSNDVSVLDRELSHEAKLLLLTDRFTFLLFQRVRIFGY